MKKLIYIIIFILCALGCKPETAVEYPEAEQQVTVTVYTTTWCRYCVYAKQYLDRNNVKYTEKNVEIKEERESLFTLAKNVNFDVEKLNVVPIVVVGERLAFFPERLLRQSRTKSFVNFSIPEAKSLLSSTPCCWIR